MTVASRRLGRTGLAVSAVGLGLAALGRPAYITLDHAAELGSDRRPAVLEARCHGVLDRARALGVSYLDAAASYGRAELFLRAWLRSRRIAPGELVVGSKWGYRYTGGWRLDAPRHEVKDHSAGALLEQWPQARSRLGEHLRLYQVHSLTPDSPLLGDPATQVALAGVRAQGVWLGFSTSGPEQALAIRRAIALRVDGEPLFSVVQATWNLLERAAEPALAEAHQAGLGVIVKEVMANGRLAPAHAPAVIGAAAEAAGTTTDRLATAAAVGRPWADVVLSGAGDAEQLEAAVEAAGLGDVALVDGLEEAVEPPRAYWAGRAALPWH